MTKFMGNDINLSRCFKATISVPFWLPAVVSPVTPERRVGHLESLSEQLASTGAVPGEWKVVSIDRTGLSARKRCMLKNTLPENALVLDRIEDTLKDSGVRVASCTEILYYYDYGLCADEIVYDLHFSDVGEREIREIFWEIKAVFRDIVDEEDLYAFRSWDDLVDAFRESMDYIGKDPDPWLLEGQDKRIGWGENFILYSSDERNSYLTMTEDALEELMNEISGSVKSLSDIRIGHEQIEYASHGFSSNLAVLKTEEMAEAACMRWRHLSINWAAFYTLNEGINRRLIEISPSSMNRRDLVRARDRFSKIRKVSNLITNESSPEVFCLDVIDETFYEELWNAWKVDDLVENLNNNISHFDNTLDDLSDKLSSLSARRIDHVLLIVNILTGISVSVQVISFWDYNKEIGQSVRLTLIVLFLILFVVGTSVYATRLFRRVS